MNSVLQRFEHSRNTQQNNVRFLPEITATYVGNDKVSITVFYVNNIGLEINVEHYIGTLSKAYLGRSEDCLDLID